MDIHAIIRVLSDVFSLTVFLPLAVISVCGTWRDGLSQDFNFPRNAPNWEAVANSPKYVWPADRMNTERWSDFPVGTGCVTAACEVQSWEGNRDTPFGGQGQCVLHSYQLHCSKGIEERKKHLLKAGWLNYTVLRTPIGGCPQDNEHRRRERSYKAKRAVSGAKHWPHQM